MTLIKRFIFVAILSFLAARQNARAAVTDYAPSLTGGGLVEQGKSLHLNFSTLIGSKG